MRLPLHSFLRAESHRTRPKTRVVIPEAPQALSGTGWRPLAKARTARRDDPGPGFRNYVARLRLAAMERKLHFNCTVFHIRSLIGHTHPLIPAKAGIQIIRPDGGQEAAVRTSNPAPALWTPAFAGVSGRKGWADGSCTPIALFFARGVSLNRRSRPRPGRLVPRVWSCGQVPGFYGENVRSGR